MNPTWEPDQPDVYTRVDAVSPDAYMRAATALAGEDGMAATRVFRSGNSQAVRIPADLAYAETDIELTITRHGEVITIFPRRQDLKGAVARLRAMPKPSMVERREVIELPDRD